MSILQVVSNMQAKMKDTRNAEPNENSGVEKVFAVTENAIESQRTKGINVAWALPPRSNKVGQECPTYGSEKPLGRWTGLAVVVLRVDDDFDASVGADAAGGALWMPRTIAAHAHGEDLRFPQSKLLQCVED